MPSVSVLAEPSVALIDSVVDKKDTRQAAQAYLEYLYSDEAQHLAAQNFYRPSNATILAEYQAQFPVLKLRSLNDLFGAGWSVVQPRFFNDCGVFDHILEEIYR